MTSKFHKQVSFYKSGIRLLGSVLAIVTASNPVVGVIVLASGYGLAEILGVVEEWFE